jgi:hypothetical protein
MCARNEGKRVDVVELHIQLRYRKRRRGERKLTDLSRDATTEEPPCTSWADPPVLDIIRVRPHEIYYAINSSHIESKHASCSELTAKCAFVRDFLCPRENADLVERADVWRKASVDTEYFAVNDLPTRNE